jgi:hypothetical protein
VLAVPHRRRWLRVKRSTKPNSSRLGLKPPIRGIAFENRSDILRIQVRAE